MFLLSQIAGFFDQLFFGTLAFSMDLYGFLQAQFRWRWSRLVQTCQVLVKSVVLKIA